MEAPLLPARGPQGALRGPVRAHLPLRRRHTPPSSSSMELSYTDDGDQFEAYVYGQRKPTSFKSWACQPLPPPPFVRDPACRKLHPQITSYAVAGGGAQILVSAEGAGTYCMDTGTRKLSAVGRWMLPLYGRVEYVPELGLWFGLSAKHQLSDADLSDLDSRPRRVGTWKEEFDPPEDWKLLQEPQLVNLGSGRFCVARFFHTTTTAGYYGDEFIDRAFGVLTGVEVVPRVYERNRTGSGDASNNCDGGNGNGNGGRAKLRMVKHRSRCHVSANGTVIESVF
ncbi:hypothetical protein SEVIR_1G369800v4 [Setaria viridis]|uniref:Uncharacterized protein n=1 Tax=Setaria viridis TaxID=4556 RepID=A0A4U6WIU6_SETVI|nr:hypothetical protein SEVIR_1G369800v2 [Setaria viridis]